MDGQIQFSFSDRVVSVRPGPQLATGVNAGGGGGTLANGKERNLKYIRTHWLIVVESVEVSPNVEEAVATDGTRVPAS